MKSNKINYVIIGFLTIGFVTPGLLVSGQTKNLTYRELTKTNICLEIQGFVFLSGLRPNSKGNPNGAGDEVAMKKWAGSGFIVQGDGTIFTNYHVARRAVTAKAYFEDGSSFDVPYIKVYDSVNDIAVLKMRSFNKTFPTVKLGDSDKIQVMDRVIAVGNTLGEKLAVTEGMINQVKVDPKNVKYRIRHSAIIAPGNSGGALYRGREVIGINVAIRPPYAIHYAIPINLSKRLLKYKKETLWQNAFPHSLSSIVKKAKQVLTKSGSVPGRSAKGVGVWGYSLKVYPLEDLIFFLKAQQGRDLAMAVKDSRGKLIGYGDKRKVNYDYILLSSDHYQTVSVYIFNHDQNPASFAMGVYKIGW